MSKIDFKELKRKTDIVDVIGRYVPLKKEGPNYVCNCPFHTEESASFKVTASKQIFKCFGCGKAGDVIDFLVFWGLSFKDAIKVLEDPNNVSAVSYGGTVEGTNRIKPIEWTPIVPRAPFKQPEIVHYKHGKPSKFWFYRNEKGHPVGIVCRFDLPNGKKEVLPFSFCIDETKTREEWRWKGLQKPRPLYNLNLISIRKTEPVLLGEGEKTADAMHALFIAYTCSTWIGGVEGLKHTDFSPLKDRDVVLWPDNDKDKKYGEGPRKGEVMDFQDQPGNKAMLMVADILKPIASSIKWVRNSPEFPCGWDVADSSWTAEEAAAYLAENTTEVPERKPAQDPAPRRTTPPPVELRGENNDWKKAV
jgi:hypothetical protein